MTGEIGDHDRTPPQGPRIKGPAGCSESDILAFAARIQELNERAAEAYAPLVEDILRANDRDVRRIEQTLDGLLDFCGHGPALMLYRRLCRHYGTIDPAAAAQYIRFYREMWDSESLTDRNDPPE